MDRFVFDIDGFSIRRRYNRHERDLRRDGHVKSALLKRKQMGRPFVARSFREHIDRIFFLRNVLLSLMHLFDCFVVFLSMKQNISGDIKKLAEKRNPQQFFFTDDGGVGGIRVSQNQEVGVVLMIRDVNAGLGRQ